MTTETALAHIQSGGTVTIVPSAHDDLVNTTMAEVRQFLSLDTSRFSDLDVALFLRQCVRLGADPFRGDIFLVPYGGRPTAVLGKDFTYAKINKECADDIEYWKSGIISTFTDAEGKSDGELWYRESNDVLLPQNGETLIGGWSEIKRRSRTEPSRYEAPLHVWTKATVPTGHDDSGNPIWPKRGNRGTIGPNNWNTMAGLMIRKTARTQHGKEEFAELFSGMNTDAEIPQSASEGAVIEVEPRPVSNNGPVSSPPKSLPRSWYSHQRFRQEMRQSGVTLEEVRALLGGGNVTEARILKYAEDNDFDDMTAFLEWVVKTVHAMRDIEVEEDWEVDDAEPPIMEQVKLWIEQAGVKVAAVEELLVGPFTEENLLGYGSKNDLTSAEDFTQHLGAKLL